jgi:hypothetical protein
MRVLGGREIKFVHLRKQGRRSAFASLRRTKGAVAQLVEQRTENPCVGGSIPPHTTSKLVVNQRVFSFFRRDLTTIFHLGCGIGVRNYRNITTVLIIPDVVFLLLCSAVFLSLITSSNHQWNLYQAIQELVQNKIVSLLLFAQRMYSACGNSKPGLRLVTKPPETI